MREVKEATENALNELADLLEYGHLIASTDPAAFIELATHKIKALQTRIDAAVEIFPLCADRDSDIPFSDLLKILTSETEKEGN